MAGPDLRSPRRHRPRDGGGRRPLPAGPARRGRQDLHARAQGGAGLVRRAASRRPGQARRPARPPPRRRCSTRALKLNPNSAQVLSNLGRTLVGAQPRRRGARVPRQGAGACAGQFRGAQQSRQRAAQARPRRRGARRLRAGAGDRAALPRRARQSRQCAGAARPLRRGGRAIRRACWRCIPRMPRRTSTAAMRSRASAAPTKRSRPTIARWRCAPDYAKARIGRGAALQALNRHQEALAGIRRRARRPTRTMPTPSTTRRCRS